MISILRPKHGSAWNLDEEKTLIQLVGNIKSSQEYDRVAQILQRSPTAVLFRLRKIAIDLYHNKISIAIIHNTTKLPMEDIRSLISLKITEQNVGRIQHKAFKNITEHKVGHVQQVSSKYLNSPSRNSSQSKDQQTMLLAKVLQLENEIKSIKLLQSQNTVHSPDTECHDIWMHNSSGSDSDSESACFLNDFQLNDSCVNQTERSMNSSNPKQITTRNNTANNTINVPTNVPANVPTNVSTNVKKSIVDNSKNHGPSSSNCQHFDCENSSLDSSLSSSSTNLSSSSTDLTNQDDICSSSLKSYNKLFRQNN